MPVPHSVAHGKWTVHERLGEGNFGVVHRGICSETQEEFAIKFEENNRRRAPNQLQDEFKHMQHLGIPGPVPQGIMRAFFFGNEAKTMHNFAVLELLGKSLEDCLSITKGKFSVTTTVLIAEQCLQRFEYLHSKGLVHRDVKPENFMLGVGQKSHHIYLVDYGLSQLYFSQEHQPMLTDVSLVGNARYASLNTHAGMQQSRRDDLESFGHVLFQFLLGTLPWTGLAARTTEEKYRKIREKKATTAIGDMCKGLPEQFGTYLSTCRNLSYTERPDYRYLRGLFTTVRQQLDKQAGASMTDHDFEWCAGSAVPDDCEALIFHDYTQPDDMDGKTFKGNLDVVVDPESTPDWRQRSLKSPAHVPFLNLAEVDGNEDDEATPRTLHGNVAF